jgi:hypothetical protein
MKPKYRYFDVQFHMLPDELLGFVQEMMAKYGINVDLERWFPKTKRNVAATQSLKDAVAKFGYPDRIWLLMHELKLRPGGEYMMLNTGDLKGRILTESTLSGRTNDEDAYLKWKAIFAELTRRAPSGGWHVSPEFKAKGFTKRCHFSPAAAAASRRGEIVLKDNLGAQSPNYMVPDDPDLS